MQYERFWHGKVYEPARRILQKQVLNIGYYYNIIYICMSMVRGVCHVQECNYQECNYRACDVYACVSLRCRDLANEGGNNLPRPKDFDGYLADAWGTSTRHSHTLRAQKCYHGGWVTYSALVTALKVSGRAHSMYMYVK